MKRTLTIEQCKALLNVIEMQGRNKSKVTDRALVLSLLLCSGESRTWTWDDASRHFLNMPTAVYEALRALAMEKKLSLFPFNHERFLKAHWLGMTALNRHVFTIGKTALTTQEVSRRLNRFGRRAGIVNCNLRLVVNTHHLLMDLYGDGEAVSDALGINPTPSPSPITKNKNVIREGNKKAEGRLHGIGRRGLSSMFPR